MPAHETRSGLISKTETLLTEYHCGDESVDTIAQIIDNLAALAHLEHAVCADGVATLSINASALMQDSTVDGGR